MLEKYHRDNSIHICAAHVAQNANNARTFVMWWSLCDKWLQHCQKETLVFVTNTYCSPPTWKIVRKVKPVLKMSISGTNTSSYAFMPVTGVLSVADLLLSTAALLSICYSYRIQTWASMVVSYFARWILSLTCNRPLNSAAVFNFQKVA